MTTSFSIARVGQLIRKQAIENGRIYLMSGLAIFGSQALMLAFAILINQPHFNETIFYVFYVSGLLICGSVFASRAFSMLGYRARGIYWLGFPASHLEKLVTTILYSTILFFILYTAGFFVLKQIALLYIHNNPRIIYTSFNWERGFGRTLPNMVIAFFAIQSFYLLGSVYFQHAAFIKTTLVAVLTIFVLVYLYKMVLDGLLPAGYIWRGFDITYFGNDGSWSKTYSASPGVTHFLSWVLRLIWAPFFWTVTWFRLKEKQI